MNFKLNAKTVGSIFLAVLLLLLFFSKTIYTYNLPVVTGTLPVNNTLNKFEKTSGIVQWQNVEGIYSDTEAKIADILVKEGELVKKGQPLVSLSFDEEDIHVKLKDIELNRNKTLLEIETIQNNLNKTGSDIAHASKEVYEKDSTSDYELIELNNKITQVKKAYELKKQTKEEAYAKSKILYEAGAINRQELTNFEDELATMKTDYDHEITNLQNQYINAKKLLEDKQQKTAKEYSDKEKTRSKQIIDYQYQSKSLAQELKSKRLDLTNYDVQEARYRKLLTDHQTKQTLFAPNDGAIISMPLKKGEYINAKQLIISLGIGNEYKVECDVALQNNFIAVNDVCKLSNTNRSLKGTVSKIAPTENAKKITVSVTSDNISVGETMDLYFEKKSTESYVTIPNGAVNKDKDGYFTYIIKEREGILGKEFYVEKLRIYIGDSDNENTIVVKGITFFEPLVLISNKAFSENATVILKNESDFFAK